MSKLISCNQPEKKGRKEKRKQWKSFYLTCCEREAKWKRSRSPASRFKKWSQPNTGSYFLRYVMMHTLVHQVDTASLYGYQGLSIYGSNASYGEYFIKFFLKSESKKYSQ